MTADSFWHRYTYYVTTPIPRKKKCTVPVSPLFDTDSCLKNIVDTNNDTLTAGILFCGQEKRSQYFCLYLQRVLIDFRNSFNSKLSDIFVVK